MIILGWLGFSIAVAMFAHVRRNRDGVSWFFIALILSPLVAVVMLLILPKLAPRDQLMPLAIEHREPIDKPALIVFAVTVGIMLLIVLGIAVAHAQQQTPSQQVFRDASGRTTMTATQSGNQTTYRDNESGRTIGTSTIGSSGQQYNIRKGK